MWFRLSAGFMIGLCEVPANPENQAKARLSPASSLLISPLCFRAARASFVH